MDSSVKKKALEKIEKFFLKLANKVRQKLEPSSNLRLVDLTPTDSAEDCDAYFEAIDQGMKNPNVKNIALTGPYGSGKSSIIKSYEKQRSGIYRLLNISLASFKEEGKQLTSEQKEDQDRSIERSIIQQMFYGADSSKLVHSRFKRIKTMQSGTAAFISLTYFIWFISSIFLFSIDISNLLFYSEFFSLEVFCLIYAAAIPTLLFYDFLKLKSGFSFKKLSLKNLELETGEVTENSILNRYLDEIIYFFQVSKYNLVVIEDLDRFGSPEIFVKLREINKLINDNDKTTGEIKFLYALKDDMFVHKNRAKFFDLIIPVIPIVNSKNSLDKILNTRLNKIDSNVYNDLKGSRFLRDVSYYLDDMRLIHNIFNEFEIYYKLLKIDNDNSIKLFSLIIFKNMYPNDFELLHHGEGFFKTLCNKKSELIKDRKRDINLKIINLEARIKEIEAEELVSYEELISIYLKELSKENNNAYAYQKNNQIRHFSSITSVEEFLSLFGNRQTLYTHNSSTYFSIRLSDFEAKLAFKNSFEERKLSIENKENRKTSVLLNEISELRNLSSQINQFKLSELLKEQPNIFDEHLYKNEKLSNLGLLRYLVFEGHLDESYYLYISKFYEGRKTLSDQAFIMTVRSYSSVDSFHQIDNPKEVCSELRDEDFSTQYILNVHIIDYLVKSNSLSRLQLVFGYINEHLEQTETFFKSYFTKGLYIKSFLNKFSKSNTSYLTNVLERDLSLEHVVQVFQHVDKGFISSNMNIGNRLTEFLNENLALVIDSQMSGSIDMEVVNLLGVKVSDISDLSGHKYWFDFVKENDCYRITASNLAYILTGSCDFNELNLINYTAIRNLPISSVKEYIENNISDYYEQIILPHFDINKNESEESVLNLLENSNLLDDHKFQLIDSLNFEIVDITNTLESYWEKLALNSKITPSWSNIHQLLVNRVFDENELIKLLDSNFFVNGLNQASWNDNLNEEEADEIIDMVFWAEQLSDNNYKLLISNFPSQKTEFPTNLSESKLKILVESKAVSFNVDTYEFIEDYSFITMFVINNIDTFMELIEGIHISNDLITSLLKAKVAIKYKIDLLYELSVFDEDDKDLAIEIAELIITGNCKVDQINSEILTWVTYGSRSIETSLSLICMLFDRWDEDEVFDILNNLDEPYCNISLYGKMPKIGNTALDKELAQLLDSENYISSFKIEDSGVRIHTKQHK